MKVDMDVIGWGTAGHGRRRRGMAGRGRERSGTVGLVRDSIELFAGRGMQGCE